MCLRFQQTIRHKETVEVQLLNMFRHRTKHQVALGHEFVPGCHKPWWWWSWALFLTFNSFDTCICRRKKWTNTMPSCMLDSSSWLYHWAICPKVSFLGKDQWRMTNMASTRTAVRMWLSGNWGSEITSISALMVLTRCALLPDFMWKLIEESCCTHGCWCSWYCQPFHH